MKPDTFTLNTGKTILSLCDFSGRWAQPYAEAGYRVIRVDLKPDREMDDLAQDILYMSRDVRWLEYWGVSKIHGILAAPPCTAFAGSGAQYWPAKDKDGRTLEGLAVIDACLRAIAIYRPEWWSMENPVGRLRRWLGPPHDLFNPCDFGGWGDGSDAYTKKTLLWGNFIKPNRRPVAPIKSCSQGSWVQRLGGKSERTKELRSMTPLGFARAFFAANP